MIRQKMMLLHTSVINCPEEQHHFHYLSNRRNVIVRILSNDSLHSRRYMVFLGNLRRSINLHHVALARLPWSLKHTQVFSGFLRAKKLSCSGIFFSAAAPYFLGLLSTTLGSLLRSTTTTFIFLVSALNVTKAIICSKSPLFVFQF